MATFKCHWVSLAQEALTQNVDQTIPGLPVKLMVFGAQAGFNSAVALTYRWPHCVTPDPRAFPHACLCRPLINGFDK